MSRAYIFSFNVGLGGVLAMLVLAAVIPEYMILILTLAFGWTMCCMFIIPWLYVWYETNEGLPLWFIRGPHQ